MHEKLAGSFRDPSGFVFTNNRCIYRQVNLSYQEDYDMLMGSGLYYHLTKSGAMISHQEVGNELAPNHDLTYKIIQPEQIDFVSYPYEWCFSQLKEAAILTLAIAQRALAYGMRLKDASAYNVQFHKGRAVFIYTLSFETYKEGVGCLPTVLPALSSTISFNGLSGCQIEPATKNLYRWHSS